jgi:hypothetical protein
MLPLNPVAIRTHTSIMPLYRSRLSPLRRQGASQQTECACARDGGTIHTYDVWIPASAGMIRLRKNSCAVGHVARSNPLLLSCRAQRQRSRDIWPRMLRSLMGEPVSRPGGFLARPMDLGANARHGLFAARSLHYGLRPPVEMTRRAHELIRIRMTEPLCVLPLAAGPGSHVSLQRWIAGLPSVRRATACRVPPVTFDPRVSARR